MRNSRPPRWIATFAAAAIPLAVYVATATGDSHWLDTGEFVGAASDLGISHPPGHPLAGLLLSFARLLPLGPFAFRVALISALVAACTLALHQRATRHVLDALGLREGTSDALALAASFWVGFTYAYWFQAVRPEVYAIEALLVAAIVERALVFEATMPEADPRPLYVGAVAFGLALTNHHLLGLLVLPAMAPTLARAFAARGPRVLLRAAGLGAAGLLVYIYLPLRALRDPTLRLGDPSSVSRFFWVVSAQAFQKNQGDAVPLPLGERFADVFVGLGVDLHIGVLLTAVLGLYVLLRFTKTRRQGVMLAILVATYVAARAWLGFVRSNPDALGYLLPAFMALGTLAAAGVGIALGMMGEARPRIAMGIAGLLAVASLWQIPRNVERASLSRFRVGDVFDDALLRDLPPGAIVLVYAPETYFRLMGAVGEERVRPDVTLVPMPFLHYPNLVRELLDSEPELRRLFRGIELSGDLREPDLQSLAALRPLYIELDVRVPRVLYETLAPEHLYARVLPGGATDADVRLGRQARERLWSRIEAVGPLDPETNKQRLYRRFHDAMFLAAVGDREGARETVTALRAHFPEERVLAALDTILADPEATGPVEPEQIDAVFGAMTGVSPPSRDHSGN